MVKFFETEAQLNSTQIRSVEEIIGIEFPMEYRNHLLKYNGGRCIPNVFTFDENGKITNSCIDWFLAIYDGEYDNLQNYIQLYKIEEKRLPSYMLPIAHDPGGNLICISCGNMDYGYIYFWDHENEVDYHMEDDQNYSNLYLIARSFNEFINKLTE